MMNQSKANHPSKFFFNNPASLILFKTINSEYNNVLLEAVYVNPNPKKRNFNRTYNTLSANSNYRISKQICSALNISLSRIDWQHFSKLKSVFTESLLIHEGNSGANDLMLFAGDAYCIFGFSSFKNFLRTKIKLKKYWKNKLNPRRQKSLYIFNQNDNPVKYAISCPIDLKKSNFYLESISKIILPKLLAEIQIKFTENYLLVLPYPNLKNNKYVNNFNSRVLELAKKENLKIIVKPHRKDKLDYSQTFGNCDLNPTQIDLLKLIPVEFFFSQSYIKRIVASPSTSLVFAENSKLEIPAPKDRRLYRKFFLDLETYLCFIGKSYTKI